MDKNNFIRLIEIPIEKKNGAVISYNCELSHRYEVDRDRLCTPAPRVFKVKNEICVKNKKCITHKNVVRVCLVVTSNTNSFMI